MLNHLYYYSHVKIGVFILIYSFIKNPKRKKSFKLILTHFSAFKRIENELKPVEAIKERNQFKRNQKIRNNFKLA
jgi:hypothetical protein